MILGWAGFPEAVPAALPTLRANPDSAWGPHLIFDDDGALVGFGGWKGAPREGAVELGYAVAPQRQGRGIATAAVRELVTRAYAEDVALVIAHTLPEISASTSVLRRCGFMDVGELIDPDDGAVWRWELRLGRGHACGSQPAHPPLLAGNQTLRQILLLLSDWLTRRGVGQWFRAHDRTLDGRRPLDVLADGAYV